MEDEIVLTKEDLLGVYSVEKQPEKEEEEEEKSIFGNFEFKPEQILQGLELVNSIIAGLNLKRGGDIAQIDQNKPQNQKIDIVQIAANLSDEEKFTVARLILSELQNQGLGDCTINEILNENGDKLNENGDNGKQRGNNHQDNPTGYTAESTSKNNTLGNTKPEASDKIKALTGMLE